MESKVQSQSKVLGAQKRNLSVIDQKFYAELKSILYGV
jgi:hypothetical protein